MSKNILERIFKLSYSEKEYLNANFEKISSILDIKSAFDETEPNDETEALEEIRNILSDPNTRIIIDGQSISVYTAVNNYLSNNNKEYLEKIFDEINNLLEESYPLLYETVGYLNEEYYNILLKPLEGIAPEISQEEPQTERDIAVEKEIKHTESKNKLIDKLKERFEISKDIDLSPLSAIGDFILKTEISEEFIKNNYDEANFKIISGINYILRKKYQEYQDTNNKESLEFYRDFEKFFPEFLLEYYREEIVRKDEDISNEFQKIWIESINDYNNKYQEQMDAALRQRAFYQESGRFKEAENYKKAALFCRKCKQFWRKDIVEGGVPVNEDFKNKNCRTEELGGSVSMDPTTGKQRTKEGCQIVENLLSSKEMKLGGIPELLAADVPLSIDLGKDFFGIKTEEFKYFGEESEKKKGQREKLLVKRGHLNNINKNIVDFLNKAKNLEAQSENVIFGSQENNENYINNLSFFIKNIQDFIETSAYFIPGFFGPTFGMENKEMLLELSGNPKKSEEERYYYTEKHKSSLGYLAEIFGKIETIEQGLSPDSIGSYTDGTLKNDIMSLYDIWNMFSYMPNGAYLTYGTRGGLISAYHREHEESFPSADVDVFADEMETALAHPDVLTRSATPVNNIQKFVQNIVEREIKKAIISGEIETMPDGRGKKGEELERIRAKQREIEANKNRLKAKIYDEYLKSKKIKININVDVKGKGEEAKLIQREEEVILPGLNLVDDNAVIAFLDGYIDRLGLTTGGEISRDPKNPKFWINPESAIKEYEKIIEIKGYESIPEYVRKTHEEYKKELQSTDQDKFGEIIKKTNLETRINSYPEYVEILHKMLTLPKEVSNYLTKNMYVEYINIERVVKDENGNPVFFTTNENGTEEVVTPDYENKIFLRNGIPVNIDLVKYKKKDSNKTPVIFGTVLANPKARQAIALICLGFSMRDKENANPSKIYSLMNNASDGGILRSNQGGGARIFAEHESRYEDLSFPNDPFFINFLKTSGATIKGFPISEIYDKSDYMGLHDVSESAKRRKSEKGRGIGGDLESFLPSSIPKKRGRPRKKSQIESNNSWYKIAKSIESGNNMKKYNYVIITTKYDIRSLCRDQISNLITESKINIPFISIVPFSQFGSLKKIAEYSANIDNPWIVIAIPEEVENLMNDIGYWPLKKKVSKGI